MRPKKSKGDEQIDQCHLIRSSGSKDRHSKVCTSKGPRDRRVRLSANTAIDFYDVQDRLGFDRASKAIDWLMKEAKVSIDALACQKSEQKFQKHFPNQIHPQKSESSNPEYDDIQAPSNNFSFISMLCGATPSASIDFCDYPHEHQHSVFSASNPQQYSNGTSNTGWFRRMVTQNSNPNGSVNNSSERYSEPILDQAQLFSQREPVDQSSFLPSVCASSNNTQITNIGYHQMPLCKSSSLLTSNGLGCTGVSISPQFQGQEEAINRTSNKSSSASSSFLHY